jgi:hypothetical protein
MKCSVSILSHVWHYRCGHFTGVIGIQIIKRNNIKDIKGNAIAIPDKEKDLLDTDWRIDFWVGL